MAPVKKHVEINKGTKNCSSLILKKGEEFLKNSNSSNNLLDIISSLLSVNEEEVIDAQNTLQKIFLSLSNKNELFEQKIENNGDKESEMIYKCWLQECYADTKRQLIENLTSSYNVQVNSLFILLNFIKEETLSSKENYFPFEFLMEIVKKILSEGKDNQLMINEFAKAIKYSDLKCNILKSISLILKNKRKQECNHIFLENAFTLLSKINLNNKSQKEKNQKSEDIKNVKSFIISENENISSIDLQYLRRQFTSAWREFLNFQLTPKLYRKVLTILDHHVLSNITNPPLLADFLTTAYNTGGSVSLLALNGIFTLMQNYNLEYPDFYKKLYALFEPSVFYSQYKAQFFYLSDLFLNSTHIPEYMVAAFIKRLSRLCLLIPVSSLLVVIPFICNLLIRHRLSVLINNSCDIEINSDPYIMEEPDPLKCKALESSLWEIKTLQSHWHPDVAIKARFINKSLPKMENELSDYYELDSHELFQKEEKKFNEVPLNFDKRFELFKVNEDMLVI